MKRKAVLMDDESERGLQIEEGFGTLAITLLDFSEVGICVRITVRKDTAPANLRGFLLSLCEHHDLYCDLFEAWLAANPRHRTRPCRKRKRVLRLRSS